jgi:hypothetical protein
MLPSADLAERTEKRPGSSFGLSFAVFDICASSTCIAVEILVKPELGGGGFNFRGSGAVALGAVDALLSPREWLAGDEIEAVLYIVPAECLILLSCRTILPIGGTAT